MPDDITTAIENVKMGLGDTLRPDVYLADLATIEQAYDDAVAALRKYHDWLERVGLPSTGYFGLDHAVGEDVEGCDGCHALARLSTPERCPRCNGTGSVRDSHGMVGVDCRDPWHGEELTDDRS